MPATPRPLFIVNHLSERVAKKGSVLETLAAKKNIPYHDLAMFDDLSEVVKNAATDAVTHVFVEGGDGTVQSVLTEFLRQKPAFYSFPLFSIVPGGMTNQVAKNIGLKSIRESLIESIMGQDKPKHSVPMLEVKSPDHAPFYGFLFSTGAVPMITDYTKSKLHKRGIGGSLAVAGGIFRGISGKREDVMHPTPIDIQIDETALIEDHLGTLVTTLPGLILGLDPFWGTGAGPLRVTYARGDTQHLYRHVAGLWAGNKAKDRSDDGLKSWNAEHVSYTYSGPAVLDGEPLDFPSGKIELAATSPIGFVF